MRLSDPHDFRGSEFFTTFTTFGITTFEILGVGNVHHIKKEVFCTIFCLFFDLFLHWTGHWTQKMEIFLHLGMFRRRHISAANSRQGPPGARSGVYVCCQCCYMATIKNAQKAAPEATEKGRKNSRPSGGIKKARQAIRAGCVYLCFYPWRVCVAASGHFSRPWPE